MLKHLVQLSEERYELYLQDELERYANSTLRNYILFFVTIVSKKGVKHMLSDNSNAGQFLSETTDFLVSKCPHVWILLRTIANTKGDVDR